ncbi:DEAD/DEAH box helicase [Fictibacillus macauensis ZFHKF-1]|uniref:DEAD/DEAH box helicase n=1 Tax=Fictibacillus macauensis ZFHKF-1 TaxID=1196324 RepID=I8UIB6_9BACL|nr:DEAD/DEAH box helicase [Fictibacillus macauensis]EIT86635.1 DEAD/DEAH box helicase [Fictibacillus macauensis ZFHKF-1]
MEKELQFQHFLQKNWEKANFENYTPIQEALMPTMLEKKDIIAQSPTGTGKTLAYGLPLLENINAAEKSIQAVVIAPTKELVMQIHAVFQEYTQGSDITGTTLIGGVNTQRQVDKLKKKPHYIIGTPSRIMELYRNKKVKLHEVKTIVVDEADVIYDMKLMNDVEAIVKATMKDRQLVFISATISPAIKEKALVLSNEPAIITITTEATPTSVEHLYIVSERRDKIENLRRIVRHDQQMKALIFFSGHLKLEEIESKLAYQGITVGVLSGQATKQERQKVMRDFRNSDHALLLATDLAARGLDISGLTHVIHFDVAESEKQFIHRSGRTGRMGNQGTVLSLITAFEEAQLVKWSRKLHVEPKQVMLRHTALVPAEHSKKPASTSSAQQGKAKALKKKSYNKKR